jgi:hypothetical protein
MDGPVQDQSSPQNPEVRGLRVRLVGGIADGHTHIITNPDDVKYIVVPALGYGGFRQLRYVRVMDKQGLRYVYAEGEADGYWIRYD